VENPSQRIIVPSIDEVSDTNKLSSEHIILEDSRDLADFKGTLHEFEMLLLKKRLDEFNGNRTLTAKSLDVSVRWIQLKLKEMGENQ